MPVRQIRELVASLEIADQCSHLKGVIVPELKPANCASHKLTSVAKTLAPPVSEGTIAARCS